MWTGNSLGSQLTKIILAYGRPKFNAITGSNNESRLHSLSVNFSYGYSHSNDAEIALTFG